MRRSSLATSDAREKLEIDWTTLADPEATLAVYMGKSAAEEVAVRLLDHGLSAGTPVALVENAILPGERIFHTRLDLLGLTSKTALGDGPAILLIGQALGCSRRKAEKRRSNMYAGFI
ncbi:hypothetical protein GCM10011371_33380 [Novosphingobium marinum]|uniref:Siroheme synthase n=1 Tax=Novosphingobium marinum TaxID=1514948 RepID=A0A7Y9XYP4_9SPHN|nr:SAM-dependent methyltransferase [Novosphingobium marinum]NYH97061.1 siroheme synthase [Novosphingobium marinum]GGC43247.1 hypothetical protein GCM10011371_33380 [Novosphingobium marinum]